MISASGRRLPQSYNCLGPRKLFVSSFLFGYVFSDLGRIFEVCAQGNLIPVTRRILVDLETPLSAYRKISGAGESFLFESVEGGEHIGRYSFVGCNPRAVVRQDGSHVQIKF